MEFRILEKCEVVFFNKIFKEFLFEYMVFGISFDFVIINDFIN